MRHSKHNLWTLLVLTPFFALAGMTYPLVLSLDVRYELYRALRQTPLDFNEACWVEGNPKVAILGTSMALYGIVPKQIVHRNKGLVPGDVVNLGVQGRPATSHLEAYLRGDHKRLASAEIVYVTLEPWLFSAKYYKYVKLARCLWSVPQWIFMSQTEGIGDGYLVTFSTLARRWFQHKDTEVPCDLSPRRSYGFRARKSKKKIRPRTRDEFAHTIYEDLLLFGPSDLEVAAFGRLKRAVERNGSRFILVLTPKHDYYINIYREQAAYDGALVEKLNDALGPTVVVGSLHRARYGLKEANFTDIFHLNNKGAVRFTRKEFGQLDRHKELRPKPIRPLLSY